LVFLLVIIIIIALLRIRFLNKKSKVSQSRLDSNHLNEYNNYGTNHYYSVDSQYDSINENINLRIIDETLTNRILFYNKIEENPIYESTLNKLKRNKSI